MLIIFAAIAINICFGLLLSFLKIGLTPFLWRPFESVSIFLEQKLNREGRSYQDMVFRGFLIYGCVLFVALVIYFLLDGLRLAAVNIQTVQVLSAVILSTAINSSALVGLIMHIRKASKGGQFKEVKIVQRLAEFSGVNTAIMDAPALMRHTITFIVTMMTRAFIAPIFWYFLFGIQGVLFYAATQACAFSLSKYGHHNGIALIPMLISRILNVLPEAFVGAIVILCAAFVPGAKLKSAFVSLKHLKQAPPYEQGGIPLHIFAYTTHSGLGGPVQSVDGVTLKNQWVGSKQAPAKIGLPKVKLYVFYLIVFLLISILMIEPMLRLVFYLSRLFY